MLTSPLRSELFPYTTLFRSLLVAGQRRLGALQLGGIGGGDVVAAGLDGGLHLGGQLDHVVPVLLVLLRSEEHTSELQSRPHLVCRLLLEKKKYTDFVQLHLD